MNRYNRFIRFMYSRYGPDDLYRFLLYVYIILFFINIYFKSYILNIMQIIMLVIMFYRFFSKNIDRRKNENYVYLKIRNFIIRPFKRFMNRVKRNYKDRHKYIYKKCKCCKTTLKLPIPFERGFKKVKCPKCGKLNKFYIFRKEKIEVIRRSDR